MTMKEKLTETIDDLRAFVKRASSENASPEEVAALPGVAQAITHMTGYAVIADEA